MNKKILCPQTFHPRFEDEAALSFKVQVGSVFLGWQPGYNNWGVVMYARPNGGPLDFENWVVYRGKLNNFITLPEDAIFLGVSVDGDCLFLATHR